MRYQSKFKINKEMYSHTNMANEHIKEIIKNDVLNQTFSEIKDKIDIDAEESFDVTEYSTDIILINTKYFKTLIDELKGVIYASDDRYAITAMVDFIKKITNGN